MCGGSRQFVRLISFVFQNYKQFAVTLNTLSFLTCAKLLSNCGFNLSWVPQLNSPNPDPEEEGEEQLLWPKSTTSRSSLLHPLFTIMKRVPQRDGDGNAGRGGLTAWSLFVSLEKPAALLSDWRQAQLQLRTLTFKYKPESTTCASVLMVALQET